MLKPDGYAVVTNDGWYVGIWKDEEAAKLVLSRSPSVKNERIEPMVFLRTLEEQSGQTK